jgi:hypothetical protein
MKRIQVIITGGRMKKRKGKGKTSKTSGKRKKGKRKAKMKKEKKMKAIKTSIQIGSDTRDILYRLKFRKSYDVFLKELCDLYVEEHGE